MNGKNSEQDYGSLIKSAREALGLTRAQLAELYGKEVKGEPVTAKAIEMMEEYNQVPKSPMRRRVLARLLEISPVVLGLQTIEDVLGVADAIPALNVLQEKRIDIPEYANVLHVYWEKSNAKTASDVLCDIVQYIGNLHSTIPYVKTKQREQIKQLLCEYHMLVADIAYDQQYNETAERYLNKAIILSEENEYHGLHAAALFRRGGVYFRRGGSQTTKNDFKTASKWFRASIRDYEEALQLKEHISSYLRGDILLQLGNVQSRVAQSNADINKALHVIDAAGDIARLGHFEKDEYNLKFNLERYHLDKASALLGSPSRTLRFPDDAIEQIGLADTTAHSGLARRHAFNSILEARAYFDKKYFPIATAIVQNTLFEAVNVRSGVNVARIEALYEALKKTNYGNSPEVTHLGVDIWNAKHN